MAPDAPDLADLIDAPNENEANEYKCWLDLSDKKVQRDIAKHIAALTNYGGGYLIFGFNDKGLNPDTNIPHNFETTYTRDYVNGAIVSHYLEPPVHCDVVHLISPSTSNKHVLIRVPAHGATPVCLKKGGTSLDGSISGEVQSDTYYLRKPGPKSEPILKAVEWSPIFRRCALHERDHLSALIKELTDTLQSTTPQEKPTSSASNIHTGQIAQLAEEAFLTEIAGRQGK